MCNNTYSQITYLLNRKDNTFYRGKVNECLVSGNLIKKHYSTFVLNDNNPNYDILIFRGDKKNYLECKIDLKSNKTNNFYLEVYNYTFQRKTGILNEDMKTLFSYTYIKNDVYYCLLGRRQQFKDALLRMSKLYPNSVKPFIRYSKIDR